MEQLAGTERMRKDTAGKLGIGSKSAGNTTVHLESARASQPVVTIEDTNCLL